MDQETMRQTAIMNLEKIMLDFRDEEESPETSNNYFQDIDEESVNEIDYLNDLVRTFKFFQSYKT